MNDNKKFQRAGDIERSNSSEPASFPASVEGLPVNDKWKIWVNRVEDIQQLLERMISFWVALVMTSGISAAALWILFSGAQPQVIVIMALVLAVADGYFIHRLFSATGTAQGSSPLLLSVLQSILVIILKKPH